MKNSAIRQQLHEYIDSADEKKIEAIFTLVQADITNASPYTDEELRLFYDRREQYLSGNANTYTAEESHEFIRKNRNKA